MGRMGLSDAVAFSCSTETDIAAVENYLGLFLYLNCLDCGSDGVRWQLILHPMANGQSAYSAAHLEVATFSFAVDRV